MNIISIRHIWLKTLVLIVAGVQVLFCGCETPPGASQPVGAQMMDNLAEQMLTGGGLLYGAGRAEAQRGNLDKANAYQTLGDIQSANYQRDTAVKAAEADYCL